MFGRRPPDFFSQSAGNKAETNGAYVGVCECVCLNRITSCEECGWVHVHPNV